MLRMELLSMMMDIAGLQVRPLHQTSQLPLELIKKQSEVGMTPLSHDSIQMVQC